MMEVIKQVAEIIGYVVMYLATSATIYILWAKRWKK